MSTLPPTPQFNANIPIISSAGGTAVAYSNPKSPESIMKKTTLLQAQGAVDTMYDVDLKKEGYASVPSRYPSKNKWAAILYVFILLLLLRLFTQQKISGKIFLLTIASVLLIITIWYP